MDGANPTEGDSFDIVFTVTDGNPGDTLTVTFSSTAGDSGSKVVTSGVEDSFTVTAQSGAVTYSASVSDGNGGSASSADLVVTADAANTPPSSSSSVSISGNPDTEGDTATISLTNITDDSTAIGSLTYSVTFSIDGGTSFSAVSDTATRTGNVLDASGNGIVSTSHVCDTAADYIFRVTVTDGDGLSTDFDSSPITVAVSSETLVFSATADYDGVNRWINQTVVSGSTYWQSRTGDPTLTPLHKLVVTGQQIRWFTQLDGNGLITTAIESDSNNGTHEFRFVSPTGEVFALSKTWIKNKSARIDWTESTPGAEAISSVQVSPIALPFISSMK
ncbi:MAG: hypothetical protein AAFO91_19720, partial [Bacteroidota bacterium]